MFSALLGLLGFSINYTRVLETGMLPLKFAYCALYVCACGISFYIPNYCSLISKTHQSNHQSAYWMSSAYLHSIFIGALPQIKKYVEQVEKSFLRNEGGCRDVTS